MLDDAQSYLAARKKTRQLPNGNLKITNGADKAKAEALPFIFSGQDQQALDRNLQAFVEYLQTKTFHDAESEHEYLQDLSYTLHERRSRFKLKVSVTASSVNHLISKIQEQDFEDDMTASKGTSKGKHSKGHLLTDLPSYTWDHSKTYWAESRASKEFRQRKHPQRSLIGAPQSTYGENEHVWRGYLRLTDEPWVKDHQVEDAIIYPAAGFIAMAIEAARDVADTGRIIDRFNLRNVQFHSAAVIKDDVPMEFVIQLRTHRTGTRQTTSTWLEFVISTCHNEKNMRENCFGLLSIEYLAAEDSNLAKEQSREEDRIVKEYKEYEAKCDTAQTTRDLYEELASVGLNYGTAFQQISTVRKSKGLSSSQVKIYQPDDSLAHWPHVIHPATLDCMIQTVFPALVGRTGHLQAAMVPVLLEELSISAKTPVGCFNGFSKAKYVGARDMVAEFAMLDGTSKPIVVTKGLHCAAINATLSTSIEAEAQRRICSQSMWIPAMDLLSPVEQFKVIQSAPSKLAKVRLLGLYFAKLFTDDTTVYRNVGLCSH